MNDVYGFEVDIDGDIRTEYFPTLLDALERAEDVGECWLGKDEVYCIERLSISDELKLKDLAVVLLNNDYRQWCSKRVLVAEVKVVSWGDNGEVIFHRTLHKV